MVAGGSTRLPIATRIGNASSICAGKKMEQIIMKYMPFAIMLYMSITSPGFFDVLYHNAMGVLIMTGCLILYVVACFIADKILKIEI